MASNNTTDQSRKKLVELKDCNTIIQESKKEPNKFIFILISQKYLSRFSFQASFNWWWQDIEAANSSVRFYQYTWYDDNDESDSRLKPENVPEFKLFHNGKKSDLSLVDLNKYVLNGDGTTTNTNSFNQQVFAEKINGLCPQTKQS